MSREEINKRFRWHAKEYGWEYVSEYGISWFIYSKCVIDEKDITQKGKLSELLSFIEQIESTNPTCKGEVASIKHFSYSSFKDDIDKYIHDNGASVFYNKCSKKKISRGLLSDIRRNPFKYKHLLTIDYFIKICNIINQNPTKYLCK